MYVAVHFIGCRIALNVGFVEVGPGHYLLHLVWQCIQRALLGLIVHYPCTHPLGDRGVKGEEKIGGRGQRGRGTGQGEG